MSTRGNWRFGGSLLFGALLLLSLLLLTGLALASSFQDILFMPIVYKQPTPVLTSTPVASVMVVYVEADPKGPDLEGEFVTVRNQTGSSVNLTGWTLRDNTKTSFKFPSFTLAARSEVDVWSKAGKDDGANLYWGLSAPIWDNLKDCAFLYDRDGRLVHEYCYERHP